MEKRYDVEQIYQEYLNSKSGEELFNHVCNLIKSYNESSDEDDSTAIFLEIGKCFFIGGLAAGTQITMDLVNESKNGFTIQGCIEPVDPDPHKFS